MTKRQFSEWLKRQGSLNALQELYAITLEGNHGLEAVKAWVDGKSEWTDPLTNEIVKFLLPTPVTK